MSNLQKEICLTAVIPAQAGMTNRSVDPGYTLDHRLRGASRWLGWCVIQCLLATAVMLPFEATCTAATAYAPNWVIWPGSNVSVPQDNFSPVGQISFTPGATGGVNVSSKMLSGEKWITQNNESAGALGLSSQQISSAMRSFSKNTMYVFAQYSPENATGRITIQKVENNPSGVVKVYQADFTPWNGELWKAQGKYRDASEITANNPGYNPFANFEGSTPTPTDPLFHNISFNAMQVAVGLAMRRYGAAFGFLAEDIIRKGQTESSKQISGGFRTKTTTITTGYAKPLWYVASAMDANPTGQSAALCVVNQVPCQSDHAALAGVAFNQWSGGNMPEGEDVLDQTVSSTSRWNVSVYTVLSAVLAIASVAIGQPELLTGLGSGFVGSAGAVAYLGVNTIANGSGNTNQPQNAFLGTTGNGYQADAATTESDAFNKTLDQDIEIRNIDSRMSAPASRTGSLSSTNQLYTGTAWQPDSYIEYNSTKAMRVRYQVCLQSSSSRTAAEKCAAPANQPVN